MSVQTSIQLFSVKEAIDSDLEGALRAVAARGFAAVEPYDFVRRAPAMNAALRANDLAAPTGHAALASSTFVHPDGRRSTTSVPDHAEVFEAARLLGMTTVIEPYTPVDRWEDVEGIEEIAGQLNAAAAVGDAHGVRVGYHNHAHELEASFDGRTGLEWLASFLDERVVLEVDLYWVARAGVDAAELVRGLGSRVIAVHAKDGTLDAAATAAYPPKDQVPVGEGRVPVAESLRAAGALEFAVVEFDHYEGDLFDALEQSRRGLEQMLAQR